MAAEWNWKWKLRTESENRADARESTQRQEEKKSNQTGKIEKEGSTTCPLERQTTRLRDVIDYKRLESRLFMLKCLLTFWLRASTIQFGHNISRSWRVKVVNARFKIPSLLPFPLLLLLFFSIFASVRPSVRPSVCPSVRQSVCPSVLISLSLLFSETFWSFAGRWFAPAAGACVNMSAFHAYVSINK